MKTTPHLRIKRVRVEVRVGRYPHWEYLDVLQQAASRDEGTGELLWEDVQMVYVDRVDGVETPITEEEYKSSTPPPLAQPGRQLALGFPA
jgi:hypothetical protein